MIRSTEDESLQQTRQFKSDTIEGRKGIGYLVTHHRLPADLVAAEQESLAHNQAAYRVLGDLMT